LQATLIDGDLGLGLALLRPSIRDA